MGISNFRSRVEEWRHEWENCFSHTCRKAFRLFRKRATFTRWRGPFAYRPSLYELDNRHATRSLARRSSVLDGSPRHRFRWNKHWETSNHRSVLLWGNRRGNRRVRIKSQFRANYINRQAWEIPNGSCGNAIPNVQSIDCRGRKLSKVFSENYAAWLLA